ncbi:Terminase-like family protein [compost metagenome]
MKTRAQQPKSQEEKDTKNVGAMLMESGAVGFPVSQKLDPRRAAKFLYWSFWRLTDIAEWLDVSEGTLASWKSRDGWDVVSSLERVEGCLEARMITLIMKELKEGRDFKEIDLLGREMVTIARVRKFEGEGGHTGHLNDKVGNRNTKDKKKAKRNVITDEQVEILRQRFHDELFGYQETWHAARSHKARMILKSRQIGATWYFAREALMEALDTGDNQIFLSASKNQANQFKSYIIDFVRMTVGVELTGENITIDRGENPDTGLPLQQPTLYFLGTNSRTAQSYHGSLYFDEFMWVHGFTRLEDVASGMASHKQYRLTYISTPTSINDEAYPFWTGKAWNADRPKKDRVEFDVSWKALKDGRLCEDGIWRQIVTIEDAAASGCTLFNLADLKRRKSAAAWANLYMCQFIDDSLSIFPMSALRPCQIDELDAWNDIDFESQIFGYGQPYDGEVWLSYDPNGDGENADNAALVLVAPPPELGKGKFRVIWKEQFRGSDFTEQALVIEAMTKRYNVTKIDIDRTGLGNAVLQLVKHFFPMARGHLYDPMVKTRLVHKALNVISRKRLEYPATWQDMTSALMSIRRTLTNKGRHLTYEAPRTKASGHGDLAWALFQALDNEPLEASIGVTGTQSSVEIFGDDD